MLRKILHHTFLTLTELQKVGDKEIYRISNILKHRKKNGKKEILVEWLGYPSSFNSWIPNNNLELYNS